MFGLMFFITHIKSRGLLVLKFLTLYLIETPFKAFENRLDPDQAALVKAA